MRWVLLLSLLLIPLALRAQDSVAVHLRAHTVQEGDYLSKLGGWEGIYRLNKETIGDNPNLIHPESTLFLPVGSSYIKGEAAETSNYHLQAWALVIIAAIFVILGIKNKAQAPIIHVTTPITERVTEHFSPNAVAPRTNFRPGEISVEGAKGKSWLEEEATEVSLPTEKIKGKAGNG